MNLNFTFSTTLEDSLKIWLQDNVRVDFDHPDPFCNFDGLSDFSDVSTNVLNTIAAVVRNRGVYLVNEGGHFVKKINAIVNNILGLLPPEISLPNSDWYLGGGLYDNPTFNATGSIPKASISLMTYLQNENFPYGETCEVELPLYHPEHSDAQVDLMITDCFVNAILEGLNGQDALKVSLNND